MLDKILNYYSQRLGGHYYVDLCSNVSIICSNWGGWHINKLNGFSTDKRWVVWVHHSALWGAAVIKAVARPSPVHPPSGTYDKAHLIRKKNFHLNSNLSLSFWYQHRLQHYDETELQDTWKTYQLRRSWNELNVQMQHTLHICTAHPFQFENNFVLNPPVHFSVYSFEIK